MFCVFFLLIFIVFSSRMISVVLGGEKMSEITKVALDAMGGDNAPVEIVKGAVEAVQKRKDIQILLTGQSWMISGKQRRVEYHMAEMDRKCTC